MPAVRIVSKIICSLINQKPQNRSIFSTAQLQCSWMEKVKSVFTGQKSTTQGQGVGDASQVTSDSLTLLHFADEMKNARRIGAFKQFMVGRSSEVTFATAFEKYEAIIRYLGALDPTGENLQIAQKQEAAKHCNCTIADVENALAKFTWAKEAQKKIEKLKEEGKPMPKSFADVQKLVGSTPLDLARSNLAKTGQISRNALCPCGSKKKYKRYSDVQLTIPRGDSSYPSHLQRERKEQNPLKRNYSSQEKRSGDEKISWGQAMTGVFF